MKYAIVSNGGRQYKVAVGDVLEIDKLSLEPKAAYVFPEVLLIVDGEKRMIGDPIVEKAKVSAIIIEHTQGEKVRVAKFKAKARYRKVIGHRADYTKIKIEAIEA